MLTLIASAALAGLPAGAGAYMFVNPSGPRDMTAGFILIFYAAVLTGAFTYFHAHGTLISRAVWLEMPGAFVLGCTIGALTGWHRRKKGK